MYVHVCIIYIYMSCLKMLIRVTARAILSIVWVTWPKIYARPCLQHGPVELVRPVTAAFCCSNTMWGLQSCFHCQPMYLACFCHWMGITLLILNEVIGNHQLNNKLNTIMCLHFSQQLQLTHTDDIHPDSSRTYWKSSSSFKLFSKNNNMKSISSEPSVVCCEFSVLCISYTYSSAFFSHLAAT